MRQLLAILGYGLAAGVVSAVPAGPVTIMLVDSTIRRGVRGGAAILAGLLAVELVYVLLFVFGFGSVLETHPALTRGVGLAGSAVLLALGVRVLRRGRAGASDPQVQEPVAEASLARLAVDAVLVAATNPAILLLFAGVVTAATTFFSAPVVHAHLPALLLAMETGVLAWLGAIVWITSRLRGRLAGTLARKLDLVSGVLLAAFGLVLPLRLLAELWR